MELPRAPLGSLVDAQSRLQGGFRSIAEVWADVKEGWRDSRAVTFEREHLAPLGPSLGRLGRALDALAELAQRAQHELADDEAADRF